MIRNPQPYPRSPIADPDPGEAGARIARTMKAVRPGASVVEEVFLSPRVVDHDAFLDFAGRLREMLTESATAAAEVRAAAETALTVRESLARDWSESGEQVGRVAHVARTVERLEARLTESRALLERVIGEDEANRRLDELRESFTDRLGSTQRALEDRLDALGRAWAERMKAVEDDAARREKESDDRLSAAVEQAVQRLYKAVSRAEADAAKTTQSLMDLSGKLDETGRQATAAAERRLARVQEAVSQAESAEQAATLAMGELSRSFEDRLTRLEEQSRKRVEDAAKRAAADLEQTVTRLTTAASQARDSQRGAAEALQSLRHAFDQTLRDLEQEAARRAGETAGRAASEIAQRLQAAAAEVSGSANAEVARLIDALRRTMDERLAATGRELLARGEQVAAAAGEELEARLRTLTDGAAHAAQRIAESQQTARARLEETQREFDRRVDERVGTAAAALARIEAAWTQGEQAVASAERRAEERRAALDRAAAERLDEAVRETAANIDAHVARLTASAREAAMSAEEGLRRLDGACGRAREQEQAAGVSLAAYEQRIEERLSVLHGEMEQRVDGRLRRLEGALSRAALLVGAPEGGGPSTGSLADLVDRAEKLRQAAVAASQQLADVRTQTDLARAQLGSTLLEAAEEIDQLDQRRRDVTRALAEAVELCNAAERAMSRRAGAMRGEERPPAAAPTEPGAPA